MATIEEQVLAVVKEPLFNFHDNDLFKPLAERLLNIGAPAIDPLLKLLDKDETRLSERFGIITVLRLLVVSGQTDQVTNSKIADILLTFIENKQDADIEAHKALYAMGPLALQQPQIERIRGFLASDYLPLRSMAISLLGAAKDTESFEVLLSYLKDYQDDRPILAVKAAFALGDLGDERAIAPLLNTLQEYDLERKMSRPVDLRNAARDALMNIGEPAVASLCAALSSASGYEATLILIALRAHGDERALEAVNKLIARTSEHKVKEDAVTTLDWIQKNLKSRT